MTLAHSEDIVLHPSRGWTACILNCGANSNRAQGLHAELVQMISRHSATARVLQCHHGADAPQLARQAIADGAGVIAAAGGDGSVNAVASALVGTDAVLGVLPLGTLNHFAKDNGIPLELEAAVENLFAGTVKMVDVGDVNGRIFLNNSSIGLYPAIVQEREAAQVKGEGKWKAFARATLYVLHGYTKLHVEMKPPGRAAIAVRTPFIFVGNNKYEMAGLRVGQRRRLDAGHLWIHGAPNAGRLRLLWLAVKALLGLSPSREWHTFESDELLIKLRRSRVNVSFDGEVDAIQSPLRYRIRPLALKVIVPAQTESPE